MGPSGVWIELSWDQPVTLREIQITFDTYGHLFRDDESDQKAMEQMQARLLATA